MERNNFAHWSVEPNSSSWVSADTGAGNSPIPTLLSGEYPRYLRIRFGLAAQNSRCFVVPSLTATDGDETGLPLIMRKGGTIILNVHSYKHISWLSLSNGRLYFDPLTDH
jgi:hypothetical protein